jgi:hypothetical protein
MPVHPDDYLVVYFRCGYTAASSIRGRRLSWTELEHRIASKLSNLRLLRNARTAGVKSTQSDQSN